MIPAERLCVRPARVDDLDILTTFSAAMAWETEQRRLDVTRLRQGTQAVIDRPERGQFYVTELRQESPADTVIVGQLLITYEWSDWRNGNFWWIQSVYVAAAHRQSGVFRTLFAHVQTLAQSSRDACGLRLYVEKHNRRAQSAYSKLGMTKTPYEVFEIERRRKTKLARSQSRAKLRA